MFAAVLYGLTDCGYGSTKRVELGSIDSSKLDLESTAVIVIEDNVTSIRRYIFCIAEKASVTLNEVTNFYKATIFSGSSENKNWTQVISYKDSDIFVVSTKQIIEILNILNNQCFNKAPFWKINNVLSNYVERHNIQKIK